MGGGRRGRWAASAAAAAAAVVVLVAPVKMMSTKGSLTEVYSHIRLLHGLACSLLVTFRELTAGWMPALPKLPVVICFRAKSLCHWLVRRPIKGSCHINSAQVLLRGCTSSSTPSSTSATACAALERGMRESFAWLNWAHLCGGTTSCTRAHGVSGYCSSPVWSTQKTGY